VAWLAFSPDGAHLASGSGDATVALYDPAKPGVVENVLRGHTHAVWSLAFSPDGRTLASAGLDGTPKLWSLATREVALTLKGAGGPITCVAFSPDGNLLATGGADGEVRLWPAAPFPATATSRTEDEP
jgi:WD40 repeat protein